MTTALRVALLANPSAGRHDPLALDRLADLLVAKGAVVERVVGHRPGDLARAAATVEADVVAVAGGDGTLNRVVGALVGRDAPRPRLAVVPQGTANVMVAEYGLPTAAADVAAAIVAGGTRPLHLGVVRCESLADRPFFLSASAGFDAEVVHLVERRPHGRFKKAAFVALGFAHALRSRDRPIAVVVETPEGERRSLSVGMAVVAKSSFYGGPFPITRRTGMDRPGLVFVGLVRTDFFRLLAATLRLGLGILERSPNVVAVPAVRVEITAGDAPRLAVQVDGDAHATTPIVVETVADPLELVVG